MNKYFYPIYKSNLKPWIKYWLIKRLSGEGESELKVVTISSGKLFKVDKTKPLSVKEYYGNTIQDGTPTPEAPIEVQTISGDNEIFIGSNTLRLDLGGKNLLNNTATTQDINGITFTVNSDNSVTVNGTATAHSLLYLGSQTIPAGTYTLSGCPKNGSWGTYSLGYGNYNDSGNGTTFTLTSSLTTNPYIRIGNGTTVSNLTFYPQLEKGTRATAYSPYVANPIELCKIGDYQDKIINDNGTWKLEKKIGKVVLNGSESWNTSSTNTSGYNRFTSSLIYNLINKPNLSSEIANVLTNYFVKKSADNTYARIDGISVGTNGNLYIYDDNFKEYTTDQFKTWLSTHNTTVYYQLATPTTETITSTNLISQLEALGNVTVTSSTVMISNDSEIPFEIKIEYYGR